MPTDEELSAIFQNDLVINVFRDGVFGSFRHIPLLSGCFFVYFVLINCYVTFSGSLGDILRSINFICILIYTYSRLCLIHRPTVFTKHSRLAVVVAVVVVHIQYKQHPRRLSAVAKY